MKMDKLKKDDIQLEKVVSELKERLKYKDELNLNLIQTEKELLLTVGLESLLLLKKHRYNHIKKEEDWLLLYDAINILYGDISHIVSSFGLTSQEVKVCYLTYIGITISEQAKVLIIETNTIKRYKNRIKNKLKLGEEILLSVYLNLNSTKINKN
ncbi:MAG: hypothetical protein KH403_09795 [Bacteroides caccae]|nr:hypothetical protein [Bacteroides caccae]